jgi:hypothetical protein
VLFHIDTAFRHGDAFGFQKAALQAGVRLGDEQTSASAHYAVPRNATAGRAGGHSVTGSSCAAAETKFAGYFTVCSDAASRYFFDQFVHGIPGHRSSCSRSF